MDVYLRRLQRKARTGDPIAVQRYIAALERSVGGHPTRLRRLLQRAARALKPFADLEEDIDESDAPWNLNDDDIIYAYEIHRDIKRFLDSKHLNA